MLRSRNDHLAKAKRNRDFANKLPKKGSNLYGLSSRSSLLFRPTLRQRVRCGIQYEIRKSQGPATGAGQQSSTFADLQRLQDLYDYGFNARYTMRNYNSEDFRKAKESFVRI